MDYPLSVPDVGLVNGKFVDEDLVAGTAGSLIASAWANALMSEFFAILAHAGIIPNEHTLNQLKTAIWKEASEGFAGVAMLASAGEALEGLDAEKIITPASLAAVIAAVPTGIPGATFAELNSAEADQGPAFCKDMEGRLWTWQSSPYFEGYRSVRCGLIYGGPWADPEPWEELLTGGVWSDSDPKQSRLIAKFREKGRTVPVAEWLEGWGYISDLGGGDWKAPDYQNVFLRMAGTDRDTANPAPVGYYQADASQRITGTIMSVNGSGGNRAGATGVGYDLSGAFQSNQSSPAPNRGQIIAGAGYGIDLDSGLVVRASDHETRSAAARVAPVILV